MQEINFIVRDFQPTDRNLVLSTWLKNYRHDSYFAKRIRNEEYFLYHHPIVNRIIDRETAKTLIACDREVPDLIYGFFTFERALNLEIAHFMYVKKAFRNFGIAKALWDAAQLKEHVNFTHWTYAMNGIKETHPELIYNPYLL